MNVSDVVRRASLICATVTTLGGCGAVSQQALNPGLGQHYAAKSLARRPTASYSVLYNFDGSGGSNPAAGLTAVKGVLYGTADTGGSGCPSSGGCGTIFSVTAAGIESVLYSFHGVGDGANPQAGLTELKGVLYGTTAGIIDSSGGGTIFSITPSGKERTLHVFEGSGDGALPQANLTALNGVLYGTTFYGGTIGGSGVGTVFSITAGGKERVLYSFPEIGKNGSNPQGSLTAFHGTLYGTTYYGGTTGNGTVFSITTAGKERVIYSFKGGSGGSHPEAGLTALNGTFYGTTSFGGTSGHGTVFSVTTAGKAHVLYSFRGRTDGRYPTANLLVLNNVLYGTTNNGGGYGYGYGTVFSVTIAGKERVLHAFQGPPNDGQLVLGGVTALHGALYGTTDAGGTNGAGIVFALAP
jgi:uncharacterized repeat protein (TIGR03803 family)